MGTKHTGEPAEVIIGRMEIAWREVMPSEIGSRLICKLEAKYSDLKVESRDDSQSSFPEFYCQHLMVCRPKLTCRLLKGSS